MALVTLADIPSGARLRIDAVDPDGITIATAGTLIDRPLIVRLAARKIHSVDVVVGEDFGLLPEAAMRVRATYEERVLQIVDDNSALMNALRESVLRILIGSEYAHQTDEEPQQNG